MSEPIQLMMVCPICRGVGNGVDDQGNPTGTCVRCNGTGRENWGALVYPKLPTSITLVFTYQIVEAINQTEYAALGDAAKDILRIILSCGSVNLDHTGKIYTDLMTIFANSPTTKAAITAL
jgi:hypothetical protein